MILSRDNVRTDQWLKMAADGGNRTRQATECWIWTNQGQIWTCGEISSQSRLVNSTDFTQEKIKMARNSKQFKKLYKTQSSNLGREWGSLEENGIRWTTPRCETMVFTTGRGPQKTLQEENSSVVNIVMIQSLDTVPSSDIYRTITIELQAQQGQYSFKKEALTRPLWQNSHVRHASTAFSQIQWQDRHVMTARTTVTGTPRMDSNEWIVVKEWEWKTSHDSAAWKGQGQFKKIFSRCRRLAIKMISWV